MTSPMSDAVREQLQRIADQIVIDALRARSIEVVPHLHVEPVTEPWKPRGYLRDALIWEARMAMQATKPERFIITDVS